jgi:hypothetical protein
MISVSLTAVPTISMAYVSDCALPIKSDVLLLVNGLKNIVSFRFLHGVVPWVHEADYVDSFGTMGGVFAGIVAIGRSAPDCIRRTNTPCVSTVERDPRMSKASIHMSSFRGSLSRHVYQVVLRFTYRIKKREVDSKTRGLLNSVNVLL